MPPFDRPTLHDVAERAGVSYQTVSRVVNNSPHVAEKTRSRVLKAMQELNYQPNRAARMLITQRSHTLEMVMLDAAYTESTLAAAREARKLGYHLTITLIAEEDLPQVIGSGAARLVEGFIIASAKLTLPLPCEKLESLCDGIPFVQIGGKLEADYPSVVYDQRHGVKLAIEHLIAQGHTQIAEIRGRVNLVDTVIRHQTYTEIMAAHGINPGPSAQGYCTPEGGYDAAMRLLESGEPFTALFAANDHMALGALWALQKSGIRVPQDVSIVGFDDIEESAFFAPPLTTVRQDFWLLGESVAQYLVSRIETSETPVKQHILTPELVIRSSTGRLCEDSS